jgi:N-acetylglucosaminyldiphosphoundecaprenol N-acetyl-beta-D-mannosaminyltransferase
MLKLCEFGAGAGWRIFLFGGAPGVAEKAREMLIKKYPGLNIVGTENGFRGDDSRVVKKIKLTAPDLLFTGLGMGKQERWLNRHLKESGVPVGMTIGGSLDVISGRKQRAPRWAQALYIEWLYRLITEPNRWKRQLALPRFLWLVFAKGLRYNSSYEKTTA